MIRRGLLTPGALGSLTLPGGWGPASIASATPRGFIDFEDNTKITNNGGFVENIVDSISGSTFTQGTAANRPALVTSAASARQVGSFDGTNDELTLAGIPTNWPVSTTVGGIFVVCNQLENNAALRFAVAYGGAATSTNRSVFKLGTGPTAQGNANSVASVNSAVSFFGRHSVNFIVAATLNCEVDAAAGSSVATTLNTSSTRSRIGASTAASPGSFWLGEISAIVVWSGTLDATETGYLYLWGSSRLGYRP